LRLNPNTNQHQSLDFKAFIDASGDLGKVGQLAGKPAGIFITTVS